MRNIARIARIARVVLKVVAVSVGVFLLVESVIRWLPPDKIVVTTTWDNVLVDTGSSIGSARRTIIHERYTETLVMPHDANDIQRINDALNRDSTVSGYPIFPVFCGGTVLGGYAAEGHTVTFYWHGLPTQVWRYGPCLDWLRTSGGVPDPWGRSSVSINLPHLEY
jgi:hypothetical protein